MHGQIASQRTEKLFHANSLLDSVGEGEGEGEGGMIWETGILTCILSCKN